MGADALVERGVELGTGSGTGTERRVGVEDEQATRAKGGITRIDRGARVELGATVCAGTRVDRGARIEPHAHVGADCGIGRTDSSGHASVGAREHDGKRQPAGQARRAGGEQHRRRRRVLKSGCKLTGSAPVRDGVTVPANTRLTIERGAVARPGRRP